MSKNSPYIPTSHDALCKVVLSNPEWLDAIFRPLLPHEVAELLDGLPEPLRDTFIDEKLGTKKPDLCYRYSLKTGPGHSLYLPVEHKSYPDRSTASQMHDYHTSIKHEHGRRWKRKQAEVPKILMLLIYNGARKWRAPKGQGNLLRGKDALSNFVRGFAPRMEILFLHTDDPTLEQLADYPEAWAGLAALSCGGRHRITEAELEAILSRLVPGTTFEVQVIGYILHNCRQDIEMIRAKIRAMRGEKRGDEMEELIGNPWFDSGVARGEAIGEARGVAIGEARGVAIGEARGEAIGEAKLLTKQLRFKFGRLPKGAKALIAQASVEEIEAWAEAVLTAKAPSDIFGDEGQR